ncbi:MAG TPA: AraC family transcriptional regulator, partial [Verrucomicrobiales bacterium]|nr:AraC family transcriptional regulator [Verrucomicrobiales bacterium]
MHAASSILELSETHTHGADTEFRVVRATEADNRAWLRGAPVCGTLKTHRISHAGVMTARAPYRIVRMHQGGLYFLACVAGEGRGLGDGRRQKCGGGLAAGLPPLMGDGFEAVEGKDWGRGWVGDGAQRGPTPLRSR